MLFEFIFSDIIENISKYSEHGNHNVVFKIVDNVLEIIFTNKIKDYDKKISELTDIVQLYNLKDNDEIYSRKTHGLNFVRRLLRRKNISNEIKIDKKLQNLTFTIKLKLYEDENINI